MANTINPGMEQIIEAGDTLEIEDADGQKFAVTAREADRTMDFLKAYDDWFTFNEKSKINAVSKTLLDQLYVKMKMTYNELPGAVQRQLPSLRG